MRIRGPAAPKRSATHRFWERYALVPRAPLDRTTDIRIAEDKHGPAEDRRYDYVPTFILRGLTELHLEFAA